MTSSLHDQLPWMASRACGFGAFLTFSAVVMLGLLAAGGVVRRIGSRATPELTAFHRVLALVGWPLVAAHALLLLADPWLHPTLAQVAWPFALRMDRAFWAGLGTVAVVAMALATATPWLQRRVRSLPWPAVHRVASLAAYVVLSVHVIAAGSDTTRGLVRFAVIQVIVLTVLLGVVRALLPRVPAARAQGG